MSRVIQEIRSYEILIKIIKWGKISHVYVYIKTKERLMDIMQQLREGFPLILTWLMFGTFKSPVVTWGAF